MKLIDAIMQVERPEAQSVWDFCSPLEELCSDLKIPHCYDNPDELLKRLKSYPILQWMCTDESVGLNALYLDGEAVGCHYRNGRKMSYEIEWISSSARSKTYNVIKSYMQEKPDEISLINPDQDIGEDYGVHYVTQLMTDDGFYEGRPVRILVRYEGLEGRTTPEEYRRKGRSYYEAVGSKDERANCLLVQDGDEQRIIPVNTFRIKFALQP